jgi:hypothetical protein
MDKLGLDASGAFVGGVVHLNAIAKVTSVSSNEMEKDDGETVDNSRIELQIVMMCIEGEDEEEKEERPSPLYG